MTWYAETSARRSRQVVGDVVAVLWVAAWVVVARWVYGLVRTLAAPAEPLQGAGTSWRLQLEEVAGQVGGIPVVGERLEGSFGSVAGVGDQLVSAGQELDSGVTTLAWVVCLTLLSTPLLLALGYLTLRWWGARRRGALAAARDDAPSRQLLAMRALVLQPPQRLAALGPDPVGGWQRNEPETVDALAALQLRTVGLRGSSAAS